MAKESGNNPVAEEEAMKFFILEYAPDPVFSNTPKQKDKRTEVPESVFNKLLPLVKDISFVVVRENSVSWENHNSNFHLIVEFEPLTPREER